MCSFSLSISHSWVKKKKNKLKNISRDFLTRFLLIRCGSCAHSSYLVTSLGQSHVIPGTGHCYTSILSIMLLVRRKAVGKTNSICFRVHLKNFVWAIGLVWVVDWLVWYGTRPEVRDQAGYQIELSMRYIKIWTKELWIWMQGRGRHSTGHLCNWGRDEEGREMTQSVWN